MKKNQLTTTKSTSLILGKSKSLMGITKKLLQNKAVASTPKGNALAEHESITIIGDLMWEKESRKMNWDDGMEYARNLRLGGYDDWRLPIIKELRDVVTLCGAVTVAHDDDNWSKKTDRNIVNRDYQANYKAMGFESSNYWSFTTIGGYTSYAWGVNFFHGSQNNGYNKSGSHYIRCVRAGQ